MYLSTTISLSVILRLLNSKTCKICKQKNSQQKKIYCIIQKKFVDEQSRVCIHLPTHINPLRKFYPFADFLKFEEIAYYQAIVFGLYFPPLPHIRTFTIKIPPLPAPSINCSVIDKAIYTKEDAVKSGEGQKSRQKMCHFTYVMIKISTFEAEKT